MRCLGLAGVWLLLALSVAQAATEKAIVAGGCFWCVESDFESVPGVTSVVSGHTGGSAAERSDGVGGTGHYEAVEISFDPARVSYERIIYLFFRSIDPTDAGGQFCDRGESYQSAVFALNSRQMAIARAEKAKAEKALGRSIVTPVREAARFYRAGAHHQDYYKGRRFIITRAGPKRQSEAYAFYRKSCGRDARVKALWGAQAPFADRH